MLDHSNFQHGNALSASQHGEALARACAALAQRFQGRLSCGLDVRRHHASTLTWLPAQIPDAVVWPESIEDVRAILDVARTFLIPVVPFGAGTSLEGQVNAPRGGLSVDFSRMDRIIRMGEADFDVTVEAGVTLSQLEDHLRHTGLFFPVDPGAREATLGGMAATRASGTTTVRYGSMRENVLSLTAVMANGEVIQTSSRARKSAAGYDLTRLLIGSEGTLGLIVDLTLKLQPRPETVVAAVLSFPGMAEAAEAVFAILQSGVTPARIELLDPLMLEIANRYSGTALPGDGPALFIEVGGTPEAAREHRGIICDLASQYAATIGGTAEGEAELRTLWKARHECFWAVRQAWPGRSFVVTDVCVPISRLAECLLDTIADGEASGLVAPVVGHVGDGNFHAIVVLNEADPDEVLRVERFISRLAERAQRMDGTCTGEHGIGQRKMGHLIAEAGPALDVMKQVKQALDPLGILNPGKLLA